MFELDEARRAPIRAPVRLHGVDLVRRIILDGAAHCLDLEAVRIEDDAVAIEKNAARAPIEAAQSWGLENVLHGELEPSLHAPG
jgi:hypothetical protein